MCNYAQSPDLPLEVTLEKDLSCVLRISTIRAWIKVLKPFFFFFWYHICFWQSDEAYGFLKKSHRMCRITKFRNIYTEI